MKKLDLTQLGGFPLTQDDVDWLQTGYKESLNALCLGTAGNTGFTPPSDMVGVMLSGMQLTVSGTSYTLTDGYCYCSSGGVAEIIRVVGSTVTITGGNVPFIQISDHSTALTFNDSTTHNVIIDRYGVLAAAAPGGSVAGSLLEYSRMVPLSLSLARKAVDDIWTPFQVPAYYGSFIDDPTNPVRYRRAKYTKRVCVKGVTYASLGVSMIVNVPVFNLPSTDPVDGISYRPSTELLFPVWGMPMAIARVKPNGDVCLAGDLIGVSNIGTYLNFCFDVD